MIDFRSLRFGVEVECTGQTREKVASAIKSVVGGEAIHIGNQGTLDPWEVTDPRNRKWRVVSDASLTDVPVHLRAEVVTPILTYEDIPELQEVIRAVRRTGAKASETCGCHVHVSGDLFTGRTLGNLVKIFYRQQEIIIQAFGVKPDRLSKYTKPIDSELIRKIETEHPNTIQEIAYGGLSDTSRNQMSNILKDGGFNGNGCDSNIRRKQRNTKQKSDAPLVGTRFVRDWNGKRYEVIAVNNGFEYDGRLYRSLTAIAKAITGTHWNGRIFFGLAKRGKK